MFNGVKSVVHVCHVPSFKYVYKPSNFYLIIKLFKAIALVSVHVKAKFFCFLNTLYIVIAS